jgi:hypothetical protein
MALACQGPHFSCLGSEGSLTLRGFRSLGASNLSTLKSNTKVKGYGQECPFHTGSFSVVPDGTWFLFLLCTHGLRPFGRLRAGCGLYSAAASRLTSARGALGAEAHFDFDPLRGA